MFAASAGLTAGAQLFKPTINRLGQKTKEASSCHSFQGVMPLGDKLSRLVGTGFFAPRKRRLESNNMKLKHLAAEIAALEKSVEKGRGGVGMIVLGEIIERQLEKDLEGSTGELDGLAELLQHHPGYQPEVEAMRGICAGVNILNKLTNEAAALLNK
jgi:hypothetical protein